ncbi:MAG: hypothetical protein K2Z25_02975 [Beijerinckiaceae bacterium]|nr:hypothetical protein [Beijerinckiaceae bacterium]
MAGILSAGFFLAGFFLAGFFSGLAASVAKDVPSYETDQNILANIRFCSAT